MSDDVFMWVFGAFTTLLGVGWLYMKVQRFRRLMGLQERESVPDLDD